MKKQATQLISIWLAVLMIFGMLPVTASAEEGAPGTVEVYIWTQPDPVIETLNSNPEPDEGPFECCTPVVVAVDQPLNAQESVINALAGLPEDADHLGWRAWEPGCGWIEYKEYGKNVKPNDISDLAFVFLEPILSKVQIPSPPSAVDYTTVAQVYAAGEWRNAAANETGLSYQWYKQAEGALTEDTPTTGLQRQLEVSSGDYSGGKTITSEDSSVVVFFTLKSGDTITIDTSTNDTPTNCNFDSGPLLGETGVFCLTREYGTSRHVITNKNDTDSYYIVIIYPSDSSEDQDLSFTATLDVTAAVPVAGRKSASLLMAGNGAEALIDGSTYLCKVSSSDEANHVYTAWSDPVEYTAPETYTVTVTADPEEGGMVTGGGTYQEDSIVTLTATANPGYKFVNWMKDGLRVSIDATCTVPVTGDAEYVANFAEAHTHCVCGKNDCSGTGHDNTVEWQDWDSSSSLPTSGNYRLTKEVNLGSRTHEIPSGSTLNLCLNGYTVKSSSTAIQVNSSAVLNICDCTGDGEIQSNGNSYFNIGINIYGGGNATINGGTITGYDGIGTNSNAILTVRGGTISGTQYGIGNYGSFSLSGAPTISGGTSGIFHGNGSFNLSGKPNITATGTGSGAADILVKSGNIITIDSTFSSTNVISVVIKNSGWVESGTFAQPDGVTVTTLKSYTTKFESADSYYDVVLKEGKLELQEKHSHSYTYSASGAVIIESCVCGHSKKATLSFTNGEVSFTYTGSAIKPVKVTYDAGWVGTNRPSIVYTNNTNVGDANAALTIGSATANLSFTITPANGSVTAPTAKENLKYTGQPLMLITAGSSGTGTIQYKLGENGAWGTAIPTATDAGAYTVYYKVVGDNNHNDVTGGSVSVTIAKRSVTLTSATASMAYNGSALINDTVTVSGDGFADGEGATCNVTGSQTDVGSSANSFTYTLNAGTDADNYTITKVEGTLTVSQSGASMTATTGENKSTYIYGETMTIIVNGITPTGVAATNVFALTAPTTNQVAIWNGDTQLTDPQTVTENALTFTLPTLDVGTYALTAKFTGSANMAATTADISITVNKATQNSFTITNKPSGNIVDGNTFTLATSGGTGTGAVTWSATGTASVNASTGEVTINGVGDFTVTATKAGGTNYNDATDTYSGTSIANKYIVTWIVDGEETTEEYAYGATPSFKGSTDKAADAQYTYTFAGWTPDVVAVTGEATYKATYTATKNSYTITWQNDDGSVIDTTTVEYGTVPTHADPVKAATAEYTYTFAGWTPDVVAVTGEATYKATYTATKIDYTGTVSPEDGTVENVTADGLEEVAEEVNKHIVLSVKVEAAASDDTEQTAIKEQAGSRTLEFLDITLKDDGGNSVEVPQSTVLEIAIPFTVGNKQNITVYRHHNGTAAAFTALNTKPDADGRTDGTFYVDSENNKIYIYTNQFSTYAIGYTVPSPTPGSYTPTYAIVVENAVNGEVKANPNNAAGGSTVTVTVTPDKGYVLDKLTVTDISGKEVDVAEKDGKYTFKMPAAKVTVKATFKEEVAFKNPFEDVFATDYYYDAVLWAVKEGVTNGTGTTTFSPNAPCTRAQMVTFLWRAAGSPEPTAATCPFTDVDMGSYYGKAVLWAVEKGITKGTSTTTFSPDVTCTRAQMATFLCRMAGGKTESSINTFVDVKADAYYAESVQWAVENGITMGTGDNKFSPDATCTRGQMVTFLYRYYVK